MADPKPATPILKRAGERVKLARLKSDWEGVYAAGGSLLTTMTGKDGVKVEAMALHPAGLLVVPAIGPFKGERVIVPGAHVEFALVESDP